jgi:hypothetical protein
VLSVSSVVNSSGFGFDEFLKVDIEPPEIDALGGIQLESSIRRSR